SRDGARSALGSTFPAAPCTRRPPDAPRAARAPRPERGRSRSPEHRIRQLARLRCGWRPRPQTPHQRAGTVGDDEVGLSNRGAVGSHRQRPLVARRHRRQAAHQLVDGPPGADLVRPASYTVVAPLSNVLDALTFLSLARARAFLVVWVIGLAAWGALRRATLGRRLRRALVGPLALVLIGVAAVLLPRPV